MARKLPWSEDHAPPTKTLREQAPCPKTDRISSPDNSRTNGHGHETSPLHDNSRLRTPSASPPRAPPPAELMREGYDYDDIYLMVEDEFQTVAQAYTAHLHHAEYKRLVKQARKAPAKALPEPTSAMSNEAKKRLKSAALEKKQKSALRQLLGPTATEEEEEEKVVDLWSGTSLAPLMATGNQQKTSLIGLERMSSSTKAGKGFTRIESKSRLDSKHDNAADWTLGCRLAKSRRSQTPETDISSSKTGRHGTEVQAMNQGSPLHKTKGPYKRQISGLAGTGDETRLLEDADIHKVRPTPRPIGSTFLKRRSEKEREDQEKKSRLEQVPTFFF